MQFTARLDSVPQTLYVTVVGNDAIIRITGYDAFHTKTKFFDRRAGTEQKPIDGVKTFELPLPIAPDVLMVDIVNENGLDEDIQIVDLKVKDLRTYPLWIRPKTKAFMEFAMEFSAKASKIKPGRYVSNDKQFAIDFSRHIVNRNTGEKMFTPARVSRTTGFMEIARHKFLDYTVPMRMLILLHERMHHEQDTSEEIEADLTALRVYLSYGFPATEAIYATANIFYDRQDMIERVKQIKNFILDFQSKRK
ncbi:hypothetical protein Q0590_25140 [Rhodocytophaga aerolata]|uniref:Uncharacterized protein n=1 Tax=Rhodocytophaga aerolata TaxID=455078 RepID=A0ABT8RBW1_9BACT|nr:hypothetical protein [Rhodocytophaga aerolata]MDO1449587.1 hypothetical protein [Rhodocytophaga aerolata]